jgi:hypothetical protein
MEIDHRSAEPDGASVVQTGINAAGNTTNALTAYSELPLRQAH